MVGSVEQTWSLLTPSFLVKDAAGQAVLKIQGPLCSCDCCWSIEFVLYRVDDEETKVL